VRSCNEAEAGSDRKAALTQRVEQACAAKEAHGQYLKELQDKHSKASDRSKEERTELLRLENAFTHCVDPQRDDDYYEGSKTQAVCAAHRNPAQSAVMG
jgi:hypothetical protein